MAIKRGQDQLPEGENSGKRQIVDVSVSGTIVKLLLTEAEASAVNQVQHSFTLAEIQQSTATQIIVSGANLPYPGTALQEFQIRGETELAVLSACSQVFMKITTVLGSLASCDNKELKVGDARIKVVIPTKTAKAILSNQGLIAKQLRDEVGVNIHIENQVIPTGQLVASSEQVLSLDGSYAAVQVALQKVLQQVALMSKETWFATWASVSNCGTRSPEIPLFQDHTQEAKDRFMRTKVERKVQQNQLDAGPHVVKLLVYDFEGSAVLGSGGARIREMSAASGTKMMLSHRNEFYPGTHLQELRIWGKTEEAALDGAMQALRHIATAGKPKEEADAIWASTEGGPGPQMEVRMKLVVPLQVVRKLSDNGGAVAKQLQDKSSLTLRYGEEGVAANALLVEQVLNLSGPLAGAPIALAFISSIFTSFLPEQWFLDWVAQSLCASSSHTTNKEAHNIQTHAALHQISGEKFALAKALDMAALAVGNGISSDSLTLQNQGVPLSALTNQGMALTAQTMQNMAFVGQAQAAHTAQNLTLAGQVAQAAQAQAAAAVEAAQALQTAQLAQATLDNIMASPPSAAVLPGNLSNQSLTSATPTFGMPPMLHALANMTTQENPHAQNTSVISASMNKVSSSAISSGKAGMGKGKDQMRRDLMEVMLQKKDSGGKGISEKGKKEIEIQVELLMEMEMMMEKELMAEMEALGKGAAARALMCKRSNVSVVSSLTNGVADLVPPPPPPLEGTVEIQPQPVLAELSSARGVPVGIKFLVDAGELQLIRNQDPNLAMLQLKVKSRIVVSDVSFPGAGLQEMRILGESAKAVLAAVVTVLTKVTEITGKLSSGDPSVEMGHARLKMLVPARAAAAIVGPGGQNVKELNQHFGVKTHVDMMSIPCTRDMAEQAICLAGSITAVYQALPTIIGHVASLASEKWFKSWIITSNAGKTMPGLNLWQAAGNGQGDQNGGTLLSTLSVPPPPLVPPIPALPLGMSTFKCNDNILFSPMAIPAPPLVLGMPGLLGMSPPKVDDNLLMQLLSQPQEVQKLHHDKEAATNSAAVPVPPAAISAPDVGMSPPKVDDNVLMQLLGNQQGLEPIS